MNPLTLMNFAVDCARGGFFGLPRWYKYLTLDNQCQVTNFTVPGDLVLVALAVIDILLRIAGIVAVFFIVYAGIQYTTSQGNPDATAKAQSGLINALIGLALTVVAIAGVTFIGNRLG